MCRWLSQLLGLWVGFAAAAGTSEYAAAADEASGRLLKVGFAERDITPELGMEAPGGYAKARRTVFHDACKVRAAVFDDGRLRVALVGVDALEILQPTAAAARKAIEARSGIPAQAVMIGASHSHTSGPACGVQPGEFDHASPLVQSLAYEKSTCADPKYLKRVEQQIAEAVCAANDCRAESLCGADNGIEDKATYNRRLRMKNGLCYTHPGQGNPDIVGPAGPIDPNVGVIGVWNKEGKCTGCVVNYCCHGTTGPNGISANWIYRMERTIRGAMGEDAVVVFLQGASGDVTQVDNLSPYVHPGQERWGEIVGGHVGAEAVKVLVGMARGTLLPLNCRTETLQIKRRIPKPDKVQKAFEIVKQPEQKVGQTEWAFAKETVLLDASLAKEKIKDVEVQAIQVGPVIVLANPAECFCQLGLDMRAKSRFPLTFIVELANGRLGYVPTEEALGPNGGGYETRLTSCTNLEPTAGRQIVEACLRLTGQMTPGQLPKPPKAPPFGGAWTYGSVPPELD